MMIRIYGGKRMMLLKILAVGLGLTSSVFGYLIFFQKKYSLIMALRRILSQEEKMRIMQDVWGL